MNKKLKDLMTRYDMTEEQADNALAFASEALEDYATDTEDNEPYATRTIDVAQKGARLVQNLRDFL